MKKRRRPQNAFSQASRNLSVRCVITSFKPRAGTRFPVGPVPGYRTRRKAHALPIVRDEFRPAIPRRVARQHCPSPLHRHHQLKIIAASKEMIYHRTVNSLLTVCLTHRDNSTEALVVHNPHRAGSACLSVTRPARRKAGAHAFRRNRSGARAGHVSPGNRPYGGLARLAHGS